MTPLEEVTNKLRAAHTKLSKAHEWAEQRGDGGITTDWESLEAIEGAVKLLESYCEANTLQRPAKRIDDVKAVLGVDSTVDVIPAIRRLKDGL